MVTHITVYRVCEIDILSHYFWTGKKKCLAPKNFLKSRRIVPSELCQLCHTVSNVCWKYHAEVLWANTICRKMAFFVLCWIFFNAEMMINYEDVLIKGQNWTAFSFPITETNGCLGWNMSAALLIGLWRLVSRTGVGKRFRGKHKGPD